MASSKHGYRPFYGASFLAVLLVGSQTSCGENERLSFPSDLWSETQIVAAVVSAEEGILQPPQLLVEGPFEYNFGSELDESIAVWTYPPEQLGGPSLQSCGVKLGQTTSANSLIANDFHWVSYSPQDPSETAPWIVSRVEPEKRVELFEDRQIEFLNESCQPPGTACGKLSLPRLLRLTPRSADSAPYTPVGMVPGPAQSIYLLALERSTGQLLGLPIDLESEQLKWERTTSQLFPRENFFWNRRIFDYTAVWGGVRPGIYLSTDQGKIIRFDQQMATQEVFTLPTPSKGIKLHGSGAHLLAFADQQLWFLAPQRSDTPHEFAKSIRSVALSPQGQVLALVADKVMLFGNGQWSQARELSSKQWDSVAYAGDSFVLFGPSKTATIKFTALNWQEALLQAAPLPLSNYQKHPLSDQTWIGTDEKNLLIQKAEHSCLNPPVQCDLDADQPPSWCDLSNFKTYRQILPLQQGPIFMVVELEESQATIPQWAVAAFAPLK